MGTPPGSSKPAAALESYAGAARRRAPSAPGGAATRLDDVVSLRGRAVALESRSITCETILDLLPDAAMIVTADGLLIHANSAARELLNSDVFATVRERLAGGQRGTERSLGWAVAQACSAGAEATSAFFIDQPDGPPTVAAVMPCRLLGGAPHALLVLPWPGGRSETAVVLLQRLFRLTRSEAEICQAVGDGLTLKEIAQRRGVAIGTARAQVKAGAAKLACKRQTQIALLLRRIAAIGVAASLEHPR